MINGFGNGGKPEVTADSAIGTPTTMMWVVNKETTITGRVQGDKYLILFGDIVNKDYTNLDEVISDTKRIALDFFGTMYQEYYEDFFQVETNGTLTPFEDEIYDNDMAGWEIEITFKQDFLYDNCQVPISSNPTILTTSN